MKHHYFLYVLLFLFMQGCDTAEKKVCSSVRVCSKVLSNDAYFHDTEYFLVSGKDTSAFSCVAYCTKVPDSNNVMVRLIEDFDLKLSLVKTGDEDTSAVSIAPTAPHHYRTMSYDEKLQAFAQCMKKAASDYDLKNLRSVRVFLYHLPELADAVADKFPVEQNFDAEHNCSAEDTEESILAAISETSIRNDIQNVVAEYGCAVDSVVLGSAVTVVDRKHDKRKIWNADVVFTICPRVP